MADYGYIRVSSEDQNLDRQIIAMHEAGIDDEHIFADKQSGKNFERKNYLIMFYKLKEGDTLYIKSIDRLGRSYEGIIDQWRKLTERGVGIVVLEMPILNTSRDRDLTGKLIADIVLQLLSYVAQTEREFIHKRQAEGIAAAKAAGVHFGRTKIVRTPEQEQTLGEYLSGKRHLRETAAICGVSHTTIVRWAKEKKANL